MKAILFLLLVTILLGCGKKVKDSSLSSDQSETAVNKADSLAEGEFELDNEVFGQTIELAGINHPVDNIFEVKEPEMLATDSILIVKNRNGDNMFMAYSLPGFNLIKSFGRFGEGPDELQFPLIIKANNPDVYCYIQEWRKSHMLALNHSLEIFPLSFSIPISTFERQICSLNDSTFFISTFSKGKRSIIELKALHDSVITNPFLNLSFSKDLNEWTSFIGDFGLNSQKKRIVFAYKYFKRIVFIDIENKKSRIVKFSEQNTSADLKSNPLGPENTTYYWGLSANKNYVYFLYSGRTPVDVSEELRKGPGYIFVEQFDWNGNPIRKFKLDHWGYFCVSEDEKTIYMLSTTEEQPIYSFTIPELIKQP
ncbi:MAG TPA: BF3164 family lipoprotein [Bacteroidales bacterium]|nr:BF3164 family lipoprotein [Bacteroidales bacterium]